MTATPAAHRVWRVGLTGGIASGKTTIARLFAELGVPVIDADEMAREVVAPGTPLLATLRARFGPAVIAPDGSLDRRALRDVVFADPGRRLELEGLTHPAIRDAMEARSREAGGPYQIFAIPLLAETSRGNAKAGGREQARGSRLDRVLVVDCSEATQRQRLRARDGSSDEQASAILAAQASRAERLAIADDVIRNESDLDALRSEVAALHARYLALAARS